METGIQAFEALDRLSEPPGLIVVESMQYRAGYEFAAQDIIDLSVIQGAIAALALTKYPGAEYIDPPYSEWASRGKKEVTRRRIWKALDPGETKVLEKGSKGSKGHNVVDSCGMGLYGAKRYGKYKRSSP
mgnify:CR=1 FL=1